MYSGENIFSAIRGHCPYGKKTELSLCSLAFKQFRSKVSLIGENAMLVQYIALSSVSVPSAYASTSRLG